MEEHKGYEIVEYSERYAPYDKSGRDVVNATWVKLPCKPKGDGLERLLEQKRGLEYFGIWCLLLEKTTLEKPKNRGKLLNHKGEPASFEEIAKSISLKNKVGLVEKAISALINLGWIKGDIMSRSNGTSRPPIVIRSDNDNDNDISVIFNKWNSYKGQRSWKSHRELSPEIEQAIKLRLKDYTVEQLVGAIENYAKILLSKDYRWTYAWTLQQFLTRHPKENRDELQLYRFLPNSFFDTDYLTDAARSKVKRPEPERNFKDRQRAEWTKFIKEAPEAKLVAIYEQNTYGLRWLILELRPEIKDKFGEG